MAAALRGAASEGDADLAPKPRACAGWAESRQREGSRALTDACAIAPLLPFLEADVLGRLTVPVPVPIPMDRFVVKRPSGDAGSSGKRPRPEEPAPGLAGARWQEIRAEGLSCDYRLLFGKAEADEILQQLEEHVEYFEGNGSAAP